MSYDYTFFANKLFNYAKLSSVLLFANVSQIKEVVFGEQPNVPNQDDIVAEFNNLRLVEKLCLIQ